MGCSLDTNLDRPCVACRTQRVKLFLDAVFPQLDVRWCEEMMPSVLLWGTISRLQSARARAAQEADDAP